MVGNKEAISLLLQHKADKSIRDNDDNTPSDMVSQEDKDVKQLLQ